ncbi:MAG: 16S rRNA (guanine(966)-N(2))-methyltransferase RsmD [Acidobacteriota bacterium]|nr:16S rRNA (guanine(966)-N(2))-methyltransferase RsmD [Acidobacteriota bacterium]
MSRIIAGSARGTLLRGAVGQRTRPTTDRVREALFSMLATWAGAADAAPEEQLAGITLLDLYAGSGAIGLEAISRGASRAVLVENHRQALESIRRNLTATGMADRVQVQPVNVTTFLAGSPELFDVVWLDPPYSTSNVEVEAVLVRVAQSWLASDGLVVVERSSRDPALRWPAVLADNWTRRYGETQLHFGRPAADPEGGQ